MTHKQKKTPKLERRELSRAERKDLERIALFALVDDLRLAAIVFNDPPSRRAERLVALEKSAAIGDRFSSLAAGMSSARRRFLVAVCAAVAVSDEEQKRGARR